MYEAIVTHDCFMSADHASSQIQKLKSLFPFSGHLFKDTSYVWVSKKPLWHILIDKDMLAFQGVSQNKLSFI